MQDRRAAGTRAGSRGPIATRSAPRRSRTARAARCAEQLEEARRQQALGRDVEQVELAARARARSTSRRLGAAQRRVEERRAHAELGERRDLVLHQRDQRRDHDADAVAQQRGNLVAQRLAAAGGHQHQRVAAAGDVLDDLGLLPAKGRIAEDFFENLTCVQRSRRCPGRRRCTSSPARSASACARARRAPSP